MTTKTSLLPHLATSALVHGGAVALIIALVSHQESTVRQQEKLVMEDVTTMEHKEAERTEEEQKKAERELLTEQVRQELQTAIREQVPDPALAETLAKIADNKLDAELMKAENAKPLSERDEADRQALAEKLKEAALTEVRDRIDDVKSDALAEDIAKFVRDKAAPDLTAAVERELTNRAAEPVKKDLAKTANEQVKPADAAKTDAAKRAATDAALNKAIDDVQPAINAAVTEKAVPAAADALAKAAAESAKAQGLPAVDTAKLAADIKSQLTKAMATTPATAQSALAPAREAQGTADPAAIAAAAAAVNSAAAAIADAGKQQEKVGKQVADAAHATGSTRDISIADAATKQAVASAAVAQAAAAAVAALDQAAKTTSAGADSRNNARSQASNGNAQRAAETAKANLEHGAAADAASNLAAAAKSAADLSAAVAAAGKDLKSAAAAAAKAQSSASSLTDAVGSAAAGKAVDAMASGASATISAKAGDAASAAGGKADGNGLKQALGQSAAGGAMAQLSALKDKLSATLGDKNADAAARTANGVGALSSAALKGGDSSGPESSSAAGSVEGNGASGASSGMGNGEGNGAGNGPGSRIRAGVRVAALGRNSTTVREQADFNRDAYETFVKDLRERANPNNFYGSAAGAGAKAEGNGSHSRATGSDGAKIVFVPSAGEAKPAAKPTANRARAVSKPSFSSPAFGAAPMQLKPLTIDGDLSDWGPLTQPLSTPYNVRQVEKDGKEGPQVFMRWAPEGLYFAWRIDMDPADIIGCPEQPYSGDCLELFIDVDNSRKGSMQSDKFAQQICLDPFGFQGDLKKTVGEFGHDMRGIPVHSVQWREDGRAAAKRDANGYTAEAFVPRIALAKRKLLPGDFVAFNVSVNRGLRDWKTNPEAMYALQRQSSASKVIDTWKKPDTWGDMQLLGSDAQAKITALNQRAENAPAFVAPGDPVQVEVSDADMNLSPYVVDKVLGQVSVTGSSQPALYVTMVETGPNTGVFRASLDTQSYLLPFAANTIGVRGGDVIAFNYVDARGAYGEADRTTKTTIEVGYPMVVTTR